MPAQVQRVDAMHVCKGRAERQGSRHWRRDRLDKHGAQKRIGGWQTPPCMNGCCAGVRGEDAVHPCTQVSARQDGGADEMLAVMPGELQGAGHVFVSLLQQGIFSQECVPVGCPKKPQPIKEQLADLLTGIDARHAQGELCLQQRLPGEPIKWAKAECLQPAAPA
ncbi:hypothetical protein D3C81_1747170 [compost metagenome]